MVPPSEVDEAILAHEGDFVRQREIVKSYIDCLDALAKDCPLFAGILKVSADRLDELCGFNQRESREFYKFSLN